MRGHPPIVRCTCGSESTTPCPVPHGIWLVASAEAGRPVPVVPPVHQWDELDERMDRERVAEEAHWRAEMARRGDLYP